MIANQEFLAQRRAHLEAVSTEEETYVHECTEDVENVQGDALHTGGALDEANALLCKLRKRRETNASPPPRQVVSTRLKAEKDEAAKKKAAAAEAEKKKKEAELDVRGRGTLKKNDVTEEDMHQPQQAPRIVTSGLTKATRRPVTATKRRDAAVLIGGDSSAPVGVKAAMLAVGVEPGLARLEAKLARWKARGV